MFPGDGRFNAPGRTASSGDRGGGDGLAVRPCPCPCPNPSRPADAERAKPAAAAAAAAGVPPRTLRGGEGVGGEGLVGGNRPVLLPPPLPPLPLPPEPPWCWEVTGRFSSSRRIVVGRRDYGKQADRGGGGGVRGCRERRRSGKVEGIYFVAHLCAATTWFWR